MPAPAHRPFPLTLAALLLAATALSGCSGSDPASTSSGSSSRTASTVPTETASSEAEASESATAEPSTEQSASATATASAPAPAGSLRDRLLPAGEVPGFNQEFRWRAGATRDAEPTRPFGTCQRFALASIGAESVAVRGFRPADRSATTDTAGELVAQFPDATTARRAYAVLTSWRKSCADRLARYDTSDVGRLESVRVPGGTAGWYLLTYAPVPNDPDAQWFDAQGMALVGDRIAMVELILAGQDYNYGAGEEPMVAALQRAAARL